MRAVVLAVLVLMLAVTVFSPKLGEARRDRGNVRGVAWSLPAAVVVGFYDGFLGAGTGLLLLFSETYISKRGFEEASVFAKTTNLATNLAALALFLIGGYFMLIASIPLLLGNLIGSQLGVKFALGRPKLVKHLFAATSLGLIVKLCWDLWAA